MTWTAAMRQALGEAAAAGARGEVPVGAVVLGPSGEVLAAAGNDRESTADPTAHAEVLALRDAADALGHWRLSDATMVVTLEPCAMCAGALVNARVDRLVHGARNLEAGAAGSLYHLGSDPRLNHEFAPTADVRADECGALLTAFFAERRGAL